MKIEQVGAITSSVRRFMNTPEEIQEGLKRIRDIGYQAVQISGIKDYDPKQMKQWCDELGLTICATHEGNMSIVEEPEAVVEKLKTLGTKYTAYPYPHKEPTDLDTAKEVAAALDKSGAVLAAAGLGLAYHNHDIEFVKVGDKVALEFIYDNTDPKNLLGEPDTYWIQHGGGDPVTWCEKLKGRLPILHMKDYAMKGKKEPMMTSIGSGNLDWKRICAAAEASGCEWYVVEHDGGTFESLESSFNFIRDHLCD
ncbi:MAG: sugar phosphate isomerase/epimerase family protein [Candidatus Sumerlaeia bacterium]